MSELCRGKTIQEVKQYLENFTGLMKDKSVSESDLAELGDVAALQGVRKFAARIRCAMLSWEALNKCLVDAANG